MRQEKSRAFLITGTPGTGKTTFSKAFAHAIGGEYVSVTAHATRYRLYRGFDRERRSMILDTANVRPTLIRLTRRPHAANLVAVVFDAPVPAGILPKKMVKRVFVLRCHPRKLEKRLQARGWGVKKIHENVLAEILDSCLIDSLNYYGSDKVIQLDTSRSSVVVSVATAKRSMLGPSRIRMKPVDWIDALEREKLLGRYLRW